ncbi:MAG TPA: hypothetical protein PKY76_11655 [Bacteroidales bacterium]|nr:hypothetical protein [Bacteroidales bacterium]HPO66603.1 hypothetical protein [Bacteroidales bacterium]
MEDVKFYLALRYYFLYHPHFALSDTPHLHPHPGLSATPLLEKERGWEKVATQ